MCQIVPQASVTPRFGAASDGDHCSSDNLDLYEHSRLAIKLEMGEHPHLQPRPVRSSDSGSRESSLPEEGRPLSTPTTVAYTTQDQVVAYSTVSPFSTYMAYDSSLPTPVSGAGSPSEDPTTNKMANMYPQGVNRSQQPTPTISSRRDSGWLSNTTQQMNMPPSQASSPMDMSSANTGMLGIHGLETSHSPEGADMVPSSEQHYWGAFTVSETGQQDDISSPALTNTGLYGNCNTTLPHVEPHDLLRSNAMFSSPPMGMSTTSAPVPILQSTPGMPSMHEYHPMGNLGGNSTQYLPITPSHYIAPAKSHRKAPKPRQRKRRESKQGSNNGDSGSGANSTSDPRNPRRLAFVPPEKRITLNEEAKPEDRDLIDLVYKYGDQKGTSMWESVAKEFGECHPELDRAALQMRIVRAVHKHAVWPECEKELLRRAEEEYENRRLSEILKIFRELGGGQNWKIELPHVAKQLIEMGIDAFDPEFDPKKARRRRKLNSRRRSCTTNHLNDPAAMNQYLGDSLIYDEDQHMSGLEHHNAVKLSEEDDERLFSHYLKEETPSPEPDSSMQDIPQSRALYPQSSPETSMGQSRSEQVARQACEQMIHQQNHTIYMPQHQGVLSNNQQRPRMR
ncbi:hypothetical protein PG991_011232 [Apiospora marii]|uniref:Myb-like domain-containing protein n=3 Tax=Apiospora marii TaxID=335849 RepID=A0ABR1RDK8_9PEZI